MELGKKKKNTKLIRIIDIRDYGRNHDLFCNNNLLLRTARKPGDVERVNHTVLGCLNRAGVKYEIIDENKKSDIMKINLNESKLRQIVNESVKRIINEHDVYDSEDDNYNEFLECLHELEDIGNMINNFKSKHYLSKETANLLNQAIECLNKVGTEIHNNYM